MTMEWSSCIVKTRLSGDRRDRASVSAWPERISAGLRSRDARVQCHAVRGANREWAALGNDGRTTRHPGRAVGLHIHRRIEIVLGWAKTVTDLLRARRRGMPKIGWQFTFALAA